MFIFPALVLVLTSCPSGAFDQEPFDTVRDLTGVLAVFPGAEGFGTDTPAGRGGAVIRVTNLDDNGPGSLRAALETAGPRTILFEVAGVIDATQAMVIQHPFVTVAGQTAPSPGITIIGAGLAIVTHDALIQHLRIRVGDRPEGPDPGGRDGISITGTPDGETDVGNVVIDHCSISWAIDEGCSTWNPGVRDVTFRQCIIGENLSNSLHPKGEHSKGMLIGDHSRRISVIGNLFAHNMQRNPLVKGDVSVLIVNNLIYNSGLLAIHTSDPEGRGLSHAAIIGNTLIKGPDTIRIVPMIFRSFDTKPGSQLYRRDNRVSNGAISAQRLLLSDPSVSLEPLTLRASRDVAEWVLSTAGARPADRDETDLRMVSNVRNGGGGIIDSQDEVGGFPSAAVVDRPLVIPDNPSADPDGNGYTNLEEWLHEMAAEVEGR
jgi:hypothetical protein